MIASIVATALVFFICNEIPCSQINAVATVQKPGIPTNMSVTDCANLAKQISPKGALVSAMHYGNLAPLPGQVASAGCQ